MDVNNTPYFLLRTRAELDTGSRRLAWNAASQCLGLAPDQALRLPASNPDAALVAWNASAPLALDRFEQRARVAASGGIIEFDSGGGFQPLQDGELRLVAAPLGRFADLALGADRLAAPYSNGIDHGLSVFHLAQRWHARCSLPLPARRAAVDAQGRVWCLATTDILRCDGAPLPLPYAPAGVRFEPIVENPHALGLALRQALPPGFVGLALCAGADTLYVLAHDASRAQAVLQRPLDAGPRAAWRVYPLEDAVPFAVDLGLVAAGRLAALAPRQTGDASFERCDCPVLELHWDADAQGGEARLVRERYPMLSQAVPRFVSSADGALRYQASPDPARTASGPEPRELHALRRPAYVRDASAPLRELDSQRPGTIWHRVYLEARIPPGCSIRLSARAYDTLAGRAQAAWIAQPPPCWNALSSELPHGTGLCAPRHAESGLFDVLLQRDAGPARRLRGRYLELRLELRGTGRQTPALHALRVYHPRFSYQEAYLPELFRQEAAVEPGSSAPANGADVRERLLAAFEGLLTPIEGRISASERLLDPGATPPSHLPWLGEWIHCAPPGHWPSARQRRLVREAAGLQEWKGTLYAVQLALDIASDGGVQRGEIVLLENFRLRRTFATLLGVDMDDADHPLTLGTGMSGNSLIGDSLVLSESDARTFLALFAPELAHDNEREIVSRFFEQYSHQVSVLLHGPGRAWRASVADALAEHMPAHVRWTLIETEHPFVLGLAPLLAVDTFLARQPEFRRVRLDDTRLGREGVLENPAAFSPRDVNTRQQTGEP